MRHRVFTGIRPTGEQVLVQVWEDDGDTVAEVAFRATADTAIVWGPPVTLTEES